MNRTKPVRGSTVKPDHIMLSISDDACTTMTVTWRTCTDIENGYVLCTVCDGMGGANGGRTASTLAQSIFDGYIRENISSCDKNDILDLMQSALTEANKEVFSKAKEDISLHGMGTTLVACLCDGEKYYCITVGDSRIYAMTKDGLEQLSHDHSYVQSLIDSGAITKEEAKSHPNRNIITKAVGTDGEVEGDVFEAECENVSGLLLCSDGLCGYIKHEDMEKICLEAVDVKKCVKLLVEKANSESGADNITAVVIKNSR